MFAGAEADRYEGWFCIYDDFVKSGIRSAEKYSQDLKDNPVITTQLPPAQTEKVLSAIRRCVEKYGTVAKVKQAHAKWVKAEGYAYPDVSNLKKFAPAGQRGKNTDKSSNKRKECYNALRKAGFTSHAAETALNICGVK